MSEKQNAETQTGEGVGKPPAIPPAAKPAKVAQGKQTKAYKVVKDHAASVNGHMTRLAAGTVLSVEDYGEDQLRELLASGVKVEAIV